MKVSTLLPGGPRRGAWSARGRRGPAVHPGGSPLGLRWTQWLAKGRATHCVGVLGLLQQKTTHRGAENSHKNVLSHGSGGQESGTPCQQGPAPPEALGVAPSRLFQHLVVAGAPWPSFSCSCIISISACLVTQPAPLCVCISFSYKDTPLFSTNYTCKDPSSKKGHILRFWVDVDFGRFNPVHQLCDLWQGTSPFCASGSSQPSGDDRPTPELWRVEWMSKH